MVGLGISEASTVTSQSIYSWELVRMEIHMIRVEKMVGFLIPNKFAAGGPFLRGNVALQGWAGLPLYAHETHPKPYCRCRLPRLSRRRSMQKTPQRRVKPPVRETPATRHLRKVTKMQDFFCCQLIVGIRHVSSLT